MTHSNNNTEHLTQLGQHVAAPTTPEEAILERIANPHPGKSYMVRLTVPEFTSLCPITSQPDFAHIVIDYIPKDWLIESKSLKLYLTSFRNHGAFHEACTLTIATTLVDRLSPLWLESALIGTHAVVYQLMFFGKPVPLRKAFGLLNKKYPSIVDVANFMNVPNS